MAILLWERLSLLSSLHNVLIWSSFRQQEKNNFLCIKMATIMTYVVLIHCCQNRFGLMTWSSSTLTLIQSVDWLVVYNCVGTVKSLWTIYLHCGILPTLVCITSSGDTFQCSKWQKVRSGRNKGQSIMAKGDIARISSISCITSCHVVDVILCLIEPEIVPFDPLTKKTLP